MLARAPAQVPAVHHLAEVRAGDDLGRQRAPVREVLQRRAQQANAVRGQRALAEFVDDAQRPVASHASRWTGWWRGRDSNS